MALLACCSVTAVYFATLLFFALSSGPVLGIDSRLLQTGLIALGPLLALANGLMVWRYSTAGPAALAFHDDLTGLANRRAFTAQASRLEERPRGFTGLISSTSTA
jgi:GGDEF domain-containing protein